VQGVMHICYFAAQRSASDEWLASILGGSDKCEIRPF
jgi:hypothetical protein